MKMSSSSVERHTIFYEFTTDRNWAVTDFQPTICVHRGPTSLLLFLLHIGHRQPRPNACAALILRKDAAIAAGWLPNAE